MRLRSPFASASPFFFLALVGTLMSAPAVAHLPSTPTGAGTIYNAQFENITTGNPLPSDHTGVSSDVPNSIDSNLSAIIFESSTLPPGVPAVSSSKFVRLKESCGEAPDLHFDRAIALGKADSPTA